MQIVFCWVYWIIYILDCDRSERSERKEAFFWLSNFSNQKSIEIILHDVYDVCDVCERNCTFWGWITKNQNHLALRMLGGGQMTQLVGGYHYFEFNLKRLSKKDYFDIVEEKRLLKKDYGKNTIWYELHQIFSALRADRKRLWKKNYMTIESKKRLWKKDYLQW